ncbi:alpha/beta hydrolase [Massilia kyonggiensis]|nr:alpha/beta hydrolase [Massilia kyonggiensis]
MRTHDAMRRRLLACAALALPALRAAAAPAAPRVVTDALDVAYVAAGPEHGHPVVLVHDFGYDIHSFERVVPLLARAGLRVLVPWMRGHGGTVFRAAAAPRSAQPAALGRDLIDFIDALHLPEAVFAGFGWGAHAVRAAAVVRPTRCVGLVLAGIERIDADGPFERYLFRSNVGQRALRVDPRGVARTLWQRLSPAAPIDAALFARAAPSFDNPDFGAILTHAWAFRHAGAAPDPAYAPLERKFALPPPAVATIALDAPAPHAFAAAVLDLVRGGAWRT